MSKVYVQARSSININPAWWDVCYQVFKNRGDRAGASMTHSHSQLIALPVRTHNLQAELHGSQEYYDKHKRCLLCDVAQYETQANCIRLIDENEHFVTVSPYAPMFPFETWLWPKRHSSNYETIGEDEVNNVLYADTTVNHLFVVCGLPCATSLDDVLCAVWNMARMAAKKWCMCLQTTDSIMAKMLKLTLRKIDKAFGCPSYNYTLQTAPLGKEHYNSAHYHWCLCVVPHLASPGGFELGSGSYVNSVRPEDAADFLRNLEVDAPWVRAGERITLLFVKNI